MRLTRDICLVGGGDSGFGLSAPLDCHIYVIDGGSEAAIVDAGMGGKYGATDQILMNIQESGVDLDKISTLDPHPLPRRSCGRRRRLPQASRRDVLGSPLTTATLAIGDEEQISLPFAKSSGFYPSDYVLEPCPGKGTLTEGASFRIGDLTVTTYETPGHSDGHVSLLVEGGDRRYLIGGDLVFYGGTIIAQNIHDCSIQNYAASTLKMAEVDFDALLPGHLAISLTNGKRHVDHAAAQFRKLMIPRNAV